MHHQAEVHFIVFSRDGVVHGHAVEQRGSQFQHLLVVALPEQFRTMGSDRDIVLGLGDRDGSPLARDGDWTAEGTFTVKLCF